MKFKFRHSKRTLGRYNCVEHQKNYDEDSPEIFHCPYCGNYFDNGDTRFFRDEDNMIDIACKPCLWKLGITHCIHGDKIFGKGAS